MVPKHKEQRVGVFIDTQNLYHSAKNIYAAKVNFGAVVKAAVADRKIVRCLAYVIESETGEEKAFFDALEKSGIELKTKKLQVFGNGAKKGDWDVGLAIDAVRLSPKLDVVIIISGDGDFVPLVEYLQLHEGCQVEVVAFGRSTSGKLIEAVDDFTNLDDEAARYLIGHRGMKLRARRPQPKAEGEGAGEPAPVLARVEAAAPPAAVGENDRPRRRRRGGRGRGRRGSAQSGNVGN